MLKRKVAIIAKIETVSGTDAVPTGASNAILVSGEPTVTPMDMKTVDRDIIRAYFGNAEKLPTGIFSKLDFSVEIAGSGTAGTAPAWGPLLRACAFSETITAGTKVEYKPVTDLIESATIYINRDGVLHKLTGARGTVKFGFTVDQIPKFDFSFTGLFNPVADSAMPAVTLTAWKTPLPVNRSNTPTFTLHGYAAKMQSVSFDMAAALSAYSLVNGSDKVDITDRKPAGKVSFEATTVAQKDWWSAVKNVDSGALQLIHGTTAGNKVQIDAPKTQIVSPTYGDYQGILMLNGDLVFAPNAGNDEITIAAL